jgi:serine phosphatase RsbU (regulator of sigma subunit)
MIGTALLNQIINEHGIVQPAKALEELHTGIAEALKQNHNDTELRDGMDIALCSMDLDKLELTYAGANRPLWIVRNGELIVVKPDKSAIGGFHANRHVTFTDHVIQLQKGDTFYIFTDGYADQFGGPNGKKFMSGQFKKLLTEIQSLPMRQQEEHIKDKFHQWQGSLPQLDDVLVIGVRV